MPQSSAHNEQLRKLQMIGAWAAIVAVMGIAILGFWFVFRFPRF